MTVRFWNGENWTDQRAPAPVQAPALIVRTAKDVGIAYLFAILLGGVGAHRFYLARPGSAVGQLVLNFGGWALTVVGIGWFMLVAFLAWFIIDLFMIPAMVATENARLDLESVG